ncbi:glycoside hydrolase family 3 N-terminal domain-containing protein [Candidatus Deianiraea vastatrix]|uniref:beta-N-acetylhexosaminidase n=1 Tax=Candidatus Deianiraea vastatrix TaxID=2163644 RepID=A0A5B8XH77_9RICK|nr:glycoside hydrolase family 3 N-terminal domain-containing protein [Candidatus Deianiraea vastatrix]QED23524.1 Putative ATP-dependent protease [Candidatus Deianiraea vastatrix]
MKSYIFGINSLDLIDDEINLLSKINLYGIVLFARNIGSREQVLGLNAKIKNKLGSHVKICIDQEGGRVQRINFTQKYPSAQEMTKLSESEFEQSVKNMSIELKNLGFDINFAPVCDINYKVDTPLISDRSFGKDVDEVVKYCSKFIEISKNEGIDCVLKHIPGHGRANIDSHIDIPRISSDILTLENTDFAVFKRLDKLCNIAMTSHIIYDCLDKTAPFSVSKTAIDYIKTNIFKGLILTDAIEMGALIKHFDKNLSSGYEDVNFYATKKYKTNHERCKILRKISSECLSAGCDIVMHCSGNLQEMSGILSGIAD